MDRNKNHFTLFVFIIISISKLSVNAQSLGEMDARLVEKTTFINRNPNVSILVVHSVIAKLQFESNMGIIRVDNSGPGEYVLHLGSETNIITIKAESYLPFKTDHIYIKKKQAKELQVTIVKKPESMSIAVGDIGKGIVIITSNPEKATVYWDGNKLADKTPVTLTNQPAFTHSVRLELGEQYAPLDTIVTVKDKASVKLNLTIQKKKAKIGTLVLFSEQSSVINGKITGYRVKLPFHLFANDSAKFELSPGKYTINVRMKNFEPFKRNIYIEDKKTLEFPIILNSKLGTLALKNLMDKDLDFTIRGPSAFTTSSIKANSKRSTDYLPGKYLITINKPLFEPFSVNFQINKGKTTNIDVKLTPSTGVLRLSGALDTTIVGAVTSRKTNTEFQLSGGTNKKLDLILERGEYYVTAKLDGYKNYKKKIEILNNNRVSELEIKPKPISFKKAKSLSYLFPGFGQLYATQGERGILFTGLTVASLYLMGSSYQQFDKADKQYVATGTEYSNAKKLAEIEDLRGRMNQWKDKRRSYQQMVFAGASVAFISYFWNVLDIHLRYPWDKTSKSNITEIDTTGDLPQ